MNKFSCQNSGKCCTSKGQAYIYLDRFDAERIAKHLGLGLCLFLERFCRSSHGLVYLSIKNDSCPFLQQSLCSVHSVKPTQCATYPWWQIYRNKNEWDELSNNCEGINKGEEWSEEKINEQLKIQSDSESKLNWSYELPWKLQQVLIEKF